MGQKLVRVRALSQLLIIGVGSCSFFSAPVGFELLDIFGLLSPLWLR